MKQKKKLAPGIFKYSDGSGRLQVIARDWQTKGKLERTLPKGTELEEALKVKKSLIEQMRGPTKKTGSLKFTQFREAIEHYVEQRGEKSHISNVAVLKKELGYAPLDDDEAFRVEYEEFITWLTTTDSKRTDAKRSEATINRYKAVIRSILNFAYKTHRIDTVPVRYFGITTTEGRSRILAQDERERLLAVLKENQSYLYPVILFSLRDPIRAGDIRALTVANLDRLHGEITFFASKTKERKNVPTILARWAEDPELRDHFDKVVENGWNWLFPRFIDDQPAAIGEYDKHFETMLRYAKISDFRFHDLKHCAITSMLEETDAAGGYLYDERDLVDRGIQYSRRMILRYSNRPGRRSVERINAIKKADMDTSHRHFGDFVNSEKVVSV